MLEALGKFETTSPKERFRALKDGKVLVEADDLDELPSKLRRLKVDARSVRIISSSYLPAVTNQQQSRILLLANGGIVNSQGAYATLEMSHPPIKLDGFVETYHGLEEIILGVQALSSFKSTLDYCSKKISLQPCA
jgi:hypothetical protein